MSALFFSRLENRYACRQMVATMNVRLKPEMLAADIDGHVFVNVEDRAEASR
jgi:hypothetical protein